MVTVKKNEMEGSCGREESRGESRMIRRKLETKRSLGRP
jgi:hypothetical protein